MNPYILGFIGLAILALGISGGFGLFPQATLVDIDGESCQLVAPEFGRIECEPIASYAVSSQVSSNWAGDVRTQGKYVEFGDTENAPRGDLYVYCQDASWFAFQFYGTGLPTGVSCDIASEDWCRIHVNPSQLTKIIEGMRIGERVRAGGCFNTIGDMEYGMIIGWSNYGYIVEGWQQYGLNVYDFGAQKSSISTRSCAIPVTYLTRLCYDDSCKSLAENQVGSGQGSYVTKTFLNYDDWTNYLTHFTPIAIGGYTFTYSGEQAFCMGDGDIYTVELQKFHVTGSGLGTECYAVPTRYLGKEQCCPGQQAASALCNDDFQWVPIEEPGQPSECFSDLQCYGQGQWLPDYATPENDVYRWSCTGGSCVVAERMTVQCTPPNVGCPQGMFCNPNKGYICEYAEGPSLQCGDGVCSAPYEDSGNCPQDCESVNVMNMLAAFIASLIIGIIIMVILRVLILFVGPANLIYRALPGGKAKTVIFILGGALVLSVFFTSLVLPIAASLI